MILLRTTIGAGSEVTVRPGIYIFKDAPLTIHSGAHVSGDAVMFAFRGPDSSMYILGGASLDVTSPTNGTYTNIQFFGDRDVYGKKQDNLWFTVIGNSSLAYDGVLYAPTYHVWFAGGSEIKGQSANYVAVAKKVWFQDHTQVKMVQNNGRRLPVAAPKRLEYGATLIE